MSTYGEQTPRHEQRWYAHRNLYNHQYSWVLESDERKCIAISTLDEMSQWYKDRHPDWELEHYADLRDVQAHVDLMVAAPFMLRALLAAKDGDLSLVDEAIERGYGRTNWLGDPVAELSPDVITDVANPDAEEGCEE